MKELFLLSDEIIWNVVTFTHVVHVQLSKYIPHNMCVCVCVYSETILCVVY